jgi:hypothetical protein
VLKVEGLGIGSKCLCVYCPLIGISGNNEAAYACEKCPWVLSKFSLRSHWPLSCPQDVLMQLAKAVASAAAALVLKAKSVAQRTEDSGLQTQVIAAATQCALSTSQLVACTKVSPDLRYPLPLNNITSICTQTSHSISDSWGLSTTPVTTRKTAETHLTAPLLPACLKFFSHRW